jgi:DHA2 family multidrug resistance protein
MAESTVEYGFRRVIIVITAITCALLEIVDTTIVNVALNDMKGNLGVTLNDISWVIAAYAIANVIIIPLTSWLSRQFGRRNYFASSIVLFTVASFLCGNASNIWELVAFRFLQGLGGGALLVTAQTIITEAFPPEKRGMAQAFYGMGVIVGPTLGPPLGGYIVDHFSWPYIFFINIPIGIIATMLALRYVRSPDYGGKRKASEVDWLGIGLLIVAVGSLQFVLEKGQEHDWFSDTSIIVLSVTAVVGFYLLIWRELTVEHPVIELRVLKDRNLAIGTAFTFVLGFGLYGSTFIIPLYTQSILGWTALQAGLLLIPSSLTTGLMMPVVGRLLSKGVPQKYLVAAGFFIFFIYSLWGYKILTPATSAGDFFWPLIARGMGLGLLFVPITTLSLSTLKGKQISEGAALTGMMRQLAGSFGVAIITTYISRKSYQHRADLIQYVNPYNPEMQTRLQQMQHNFTSHGAGTALAQAKAYLMMEISVQKQAMVLTYMDVFIGIGVFFLICTPIMLLIRRKSKAERESARATEFH